MYRLRLLIFCFCLVTLVSSQEMAHATDLTTDEATTSASATSDATQAPHAHPPRTEALPLRQRLVVGIPTNYPPVAFLNDQGTAPRGMAVDLSIMLANKLKCEVRFLPGTLDELKQHLRKGSVDIVVGLPQPSIVPDTVNILVTPYGFNRRILVSAPEAHVTCEQDFQNRRILVLRHDPFATTVTNFGGIVQHADTYADALSALTRGEADAFVAQSGEIASYVAQRRGFDQVKLMGLPLERIPMVILARSNSDDLVGELTNSLLQLEKGGQLDLLRDKWLGRSLLEQNFWEKYRHTIFSILGGTIFILLIVMVWISTLRRQVRLTTQSLQSSERRYRELIENSPDMTLLMGPDGSIRLANRIARERLDITPESESGSFALWDAMCEEGQDCLSLLLDGSHNTQRIREELILHPDQDDKRRIMEFIAFPTEAGAGSEPLICCIGRDMTERRRLEQELIEVERLAIIGKTAASVAHEINNPLGIIMANTDVALEEADAANNPDLRRLLEAIQRNVERAATTTRRLLNIAMPQSINQVPQNFADIIKEALAYLRPRMKDVNINLDGLEDNLPLRGDRILLEQLFINLLLNALESMDNTGSLTIIGHMRDSAGKPLLHLEVRDTGKGIPPQNLERIFDPFFTTRGTKGFGLGLYISQRIVEAHRGTLHAESELGHGAAMVIEIPLRQ